MSQDLKKNICLRSAQDLEGYIVPTGQHDVYLMEGFPPWERKILKTFKSTTYSLVDYYGTPFEMIHCDLQVSILGHLTLRLHDSTYLEVSGRKALILSGINSATVRLQSVPSERNSFANFVDAEFPKEGIRVKVTDEDAFVWQFQGSKLGIDYSPPTLGIST